MVQYVYGGHNVESGGGIRYLVSLHHAVLEFRMPRFRRLDRHFGYIHSANASERAAEMIMKGTDPTADV